MAVTDQVVLSVVVMHHPRRSDRIPALLAACSPLPVRVVVDPDPGGPPSPLRTAKRAWAAIAPGATHHVVLQDDILPMAGFAENLHRAVAARPADGVTLSVQQTSPRNSYAVRRAALAGQPFAGMSTVEWTPTLALALPVAHAEALARFLAGLPEEYVDDDHLVTRFCAEQAVQVVATVPNLVEHADVVSLFIYADEGRRPVTVYDEHWKIPVAWWTAAGGTALAAPERSAGNPVSVELRESRCGLRSLSAQTGEPLEHPFTWDWRDRADLAGATEERIVAGWRGALADPGPTAAALSALRPALTLEVWAAGFLLGADLGGTAPADFTDLVPALRRRTVGSWLEMGLGARDRKALTPDGWTALIELVLRAVEAGMSQTAPPRPTASDVAGLDAVLRRMARREADALRLRPNLSTWRLDPVTRISVYPLRCPWCGAAGATADPTGLEPMDEVRMLRADESPVPGSVTLHALACEWLTARSLLPLVRGIQDGRTDLPTELLTRAAAVAEIVARRPETPLPELLSDIDMRESWPTFPVRGRCVLPASSRLAPSMAPGVDVLGSYVLTPHRIGFEPAGMDLAYRRHRDAALAE